MIYNKLKFKNKINFTSQQTKQRLKKAIQELENTNIKNKNTTLKNHLYCQLFHTRFN